MAGGGVVTHPTFGLQENVNDCIPCNENPVRRDAFLEKVIPCLGRGREMVIRQVRCQATVDLLRKRRKPIL